MNLIDKLGYDFAKQIYRENIDEFIGDASGVTVKVIGMEFTHDDLEKALLEHRRQHNIFEVGDKVVLISNSDDDIFEYTEYSKNLDLHFFESKNNYGHASLSNIRHATDAEIEAGCRL